MTDPTAHSWKKKHFRGEKNKKTHILCTQFSRLSAIMSSASFKVDEVDYGYILSLNLYNKGNWEKGPLVTSGFSGFFRPTASILLFFKKNAFLLLYELYQQTHHLLRKQTEFKFLISFLEIIAAFTSNISPT